MTITIGQRILFITNDGQSIAEARITKLATVLRLIGLSTGQTITARQVVGVFNA